MKIEIDMRVSDHIEVNAAILKTPDDVARYIRALRRAANILWPKPKAAKPSAKESV